MALRTSRSSCIVYAPSLVSTSGACHGKFKLRQGMRFSVLCKARLSDRLQLSGKLGFTKYFDRDVISSALRQIDSSCQTDLDVSAKWKF